MLRQFLILVVLTTPCFGQGIKNTGAMGSSPEPIHNYGTTLQSYGQFNYNFGNNPNVYDIYRPQVSDYLTHDPRDLKSYTNPAVKPEQNFQMMRHVKINQFNYNLSSY